MHAQWPCMNEILSLPSWITIQGWRSVFKRAHSSPTVDAQKRKENSQLDL